MFALTDESSDFGILFLDEIATLDMGYESD